ncbi:MAG: TonB-dependent receptor [Pseudomonadales bacterium]|jgi:iron complex outermembrane receptor protein|nr:TonB-dependent receptor [Pseudomonadales bacterium]
MDLLRFSFPSLSCAVVAALSQTVYAADDGAPPAADVPAADVPVIDITANKPASASLAASPATTESITREQLRESVNLVNSEDAVKYLPSLMVRKRNIGDTQAPLMTRTSGLGQSARSLIFADGVLLSAPIGNNNGQASPRWSMVTAEEIERIDVLYGPFSAAYAGGSMGAVVNITTRMPERFEASVKLLGAVQQHSVYATSDHYNSGAASVALGSRAGDFSWRFSAQHLLANTQPLSIATAARAAAPSAAGMQVTGAFADFNKLGAPIAVLGVGGLEHKRTDSFKLKLAYDVSPLLQGAYTIGLFRLDDQAAMQSYLRDAANNPVYSGNLNIDGYNVNLTTALANGTYRFDENHLMQSLSLQSNTRGIWDWATIVSVYDFINDNTATPASADAALSHSGAGTNSRMNGTGWSTVDIKGIWRPQGVSGAHEVSFGVHNTQAKLVTTQYRLANWASDEIGTIAVDSRGRTRITAFWLQEEWHFARDFNATLGGRYENWRAFDGFNYSLTPANNVLQPAVSAGRFSPKATLQWRAANEWRLTGSLGVAYRFPTVTELYQAVTVGTTIVTPNANLRPEHALSGELALERATETGRLRVSLFQENLSDALITQNTLLSGSSAFGTSFQNVDKIRSRGIELVAQQENVLLQGLELAGSATWVDSRILRDAAFRNASNALVDVAGKRTPNIPSWRATLMASYRPSDNLVLTLAGRYSSRLWTTLDNSDPLTHTYGGFDPYFVLDARVSYTLDPHWHVALGIDNLNDRRYVLFHPFSQRTLIGELRYDL